MNFVIQINAELFCLLCLDLKHDIQNIPGGNPISKKEVLIRRIGSLVKRIGTPLIGFS